MGKIGPIISDKTENRLREFLQNEHGFKHYGKLSELIENAINLMLDVEEGKKKVINVEEEGE